MAVIFAACSFCFASSSEISVFDVKGNVKYVPSGEKERLVLKKGDTLHSGDKIITAADSYAVVSMGKAKSNIIKIKSDSKVLLKIGPDDLVELIDGRLLVFLEKRAQKKQFLVKTPCAVCGARGTGWFEETDNMSTKVIVFSGTVYTRGIEKDLAPGKKTFDIEEGYSRDIRIYRDPGPRKTVSSGKIKALKEEMALVVRYLMIDGSDGDGGDGIMIEDKKIEKINSLMEKTGRRVDHTLDRIGGIKAVPDVVPVRGDDDRRK
jgi:hypothetical protein